MSPSPERAGLADGVVPRPLPHRVRPVAGGAAMRQDERAPFDRALQRAREAAYAPGEYVGQESFMTAGEIRALAVRAGVGSRRRGARPVLRRRRARAATSRGSSAATTSASTPARARSPSPVRGPATSASRSARSRRSRPARSTSCCCSRPCSPSRRRSALVRGIAGGAPAGRALRVHAGGGRAAHAGRAGGDARRGHGLAHPARRARRDASSGPGSCSRGRRTTAARTPRRRSAIAGAFAADAEAIAAQIGRRGARRPARRPRAVERVAGRGARPEARAGGRAGGLSVSAGRAPPPARRASRRPWTARPPRPGARCGDAGGACRATPASTTSPDPRGA